jgi:DNA invertase Pin-like site-specific DNA recombinase
MALIGYVASANPPHTVAGSHAVLEQLGCDRIVLDRDDPSFDDVSASLAAGDTIVVVNFDGLASSLEQLVARIDDLTRCGVGFRSLADGIDTGDDQRASCRAIFAALAGFKPAPGLRARGATGLSVDPARKGMGRPSVITPVVLDRARRMIAAGFKVREAAAALKVGKTALYRALADSASR